jgi:hypothetical protein
MSFSLRALARVAAASAAGALVGAIALIIASWVRGPITADMTAELPRRVMTGFYPPERVGDLAFAWTAGRADLVLAELARDRAWTCSARMRAARSVAPVPHLDVLVDGVTVLSRDAPNRFEDVSFDLPPRPSRADTRISFSVAPTLVPGPQDRRELGVQMDRISCAPQAGHYFPPTATSRVAAVVVPAAFAGAAVLAGAPLIAGAAIGAAVAAAQTIPLETGIAAYTPFARTMRSLGLWTALLTVVLVALAGAIRRRSPSPFSVAFATSASAALYVQLLGLLHPSKPPIDVVFQTHRFDAVLAGHYFFTQPMPGGVSFPYAIGLYLFSAPWAGLTNDHATLLRIVVCASDAAASVLLFWLVLRTWRDRAAAATALMLAFALPIAFEVIGNANLTNEFGHAASTAALVLAAALPNSRRVVPHAILLTAVCTLALVAHVSTFALLAFTLFALAALFWWMNGPGFRRAAGVLLAVTAVSAALAFAGYYGRFMDVYKDALRVRTGAASTAPADAPSVEVRGQTANSLTLRVADSIKRSAGWVGWPLLVLAAAGAWRLVRERRGDPATVSILACAAAYAVFVGVAVMRVQPAYQRYTVEFVSRVVLATSPGVLLLAGAGASWGFRSGRASRLATCVLIGAAAVVAGREWIRWFS